LSGIEYHALIVKHDLAFVKAKIAGRVTVPHPDHGRGTSARAAVTATLLALIARNR
jgi:hypothetical protein